MPLLREELMIKCTVTTEESDIIFKLFEAKNADLVYESDYDKAARAVASFKAVDFDCSHTLEPREIKTLLWLCNGEEPTEQRVKYEQALMDLDENGHIEVSEWITYLILPEKISSKESSVSPFNS